MPASIKFTFPQRIYVNLVCADGYLDQVPEYKRATWTKLMWLLVPIIGPVIFCFHVEDS